MLVAELNAAAGAQLAQVAARHETLPSHSGNSAKLKYQFCSGTWVYCNGSALF